MLEPERDKERKETEQDRRRGEEKRGKTNDHERDREGGRWINVNRFHPTVRTGKGLPNHR